MKQFYVKFIKRAADIIFASFLLILLLPLMILFAFLLMLTGHLPVLFTQYRIGWHEKPFRLFKFRTMTNDKDHKGNLLPDEKRMTGFGSWVRKTSIDELPQLINVIKGDMSIVGPRPLIQEYLPLYDEEQRKRHLLRPGITGWAQVNGRNNISWEQKFELDVYYVQHVSLMMDIRILLMTIKKILKASDISQDGHATVSPFTGKKNNNPV